MSETVKPAKKAARRSAPAPKVRAGAKPRAVASPAGGAFLVVRQVRSAIGSNRRQRATLRGLRLGRPGKRTQLEDTPAVRGMIQKVVHLVVVEEA